MTADELLADLRAVADPVAHPQTEEERRDRHDLYLARHDAIDAWDMVDRSAPRVLGVHLADARR